jgi:ABC-type nickel/cobalt efflux system permease component RcnA
MTETSLHILVWTAISIGFVHTLIGFDHSLPFIALSRARRWSFPKTMGLTALCGVGHVLSSVVLGFVGIGLGIAIERLEWIESFRGEFAAYLIIGFGLAYGSWALVRRARKNKHSHVHTHDDGLTHEHAHDHHGVHLHPHSAKDQSAFFATWSLFIIFVFGPCEALIPMLMAPAAEHNWLWVALVAAAFGLTTVLTMMSVVAVGFFGLKFGRLRALESWADVAAGFAIASSGAAIKIFGI